MTDLLLQRSDKTDIKPSITESLKNILDSDLDFSGMSSRYGSHNFHPFPAKFPPQLPQAFILALTSHGDVVLDPMMGSGTTLVEACDAGRKAVGFDIDPLAMRISQVKTRFINPAEALAIGNFIVSKVNSTNLQEKEKWLSASPMKIEQKTREFIDYWFHPSVQIDLFAIAQQIRLIENESMRAFFEVAFSATIITKSGGVSYALDLAHTRPHRAKIVYDGSGKILLSEHVSNKKRKDILTKKLKHVVVEFERKFKANVLNLPKMQLNDMQPRIELTDCTNMPLEDESVDLIVTSPPYASNAIDYMRAHKFSLIWLGYGLDSLSVKRRDYIGGESVREFTFLSLPSSVNRSVARIEQEDTKRAASLRRYFSEMKGVLGEMKRVLKKGKAAILVVGSSNIRGIDTQISENLSAIGTECGFKIVGVGVRNLDRNKRMLPAGGVINKNSQIQQRMHQEFVLGFIKA